MISKKSFTVCILLLIVALVVATGITRRAKPLVVQTNLENLPMVIAGYTAVEDSFSETVYRELNADKHVYRHYRATDGTQIDLYMGYYGTAKGGRTGHNPYACLPGGGSAIVETGKVALQQQAQNKTVSVNYILARKNEANTLMLHWYQTEGSTVVVNGMQQNIQRFLGRVLRNRNDGAVVQITAPSSDVAVPQTKQKIEQFAGIVLNLLPSYWPIEK